MDGHSSLGFNPYSAASEADDELTLWHQLFDQQTLQDPGSSSSSSSNMNHLGTASNNLAPQPLSSLPYKSAQDELWQMSESTNRRSNDEALERIRANSSNSYVRQQSLSAFSAWKSSSQFSDLFPNPVSTVPPMMTQSVQLLEALNVDFMNHPSLMSFDSMATDVNFPQLTPFPSTTSTAHNLSSQPIPLTTSTLTHSPRTFLKPSEIFHSTSQTNTTNIPLISSTNIPPHHQQDSKTTLKPSVSSESILHTHQSMHPKRPPVVKSRSAPSTPSPRMMANAHHLVKSHNPIQIVHRTNDGMFECKVCQKQCIRKQDLIRHEVTHSKAKQFVCPTNCGSAFGRSDALGRHLKTCRGSVGNLQGSNPTA
ncbi:hypothetical protein CcCBS67573_g04296 [Chytriomyces confervae]|uniref:C2H2-type domain-containing protein n=1 Tax=Chytriomyces confervae TaxID=246404 RepID=A0A507FDX8_9FUNG|nr:hypothetical protein CcCBS67573_g04296 [Chytriomyces confervae]